MIIGKFPSRVREETQHSLPQTELKHYLEENYALYVTADILCSKIF
jgi:hypothetical protein